jgi:hypothetical protein
MRCLALAGSFPEVELREAGADYFALNFERIDRRILG